MVEEDSKKMVAGENDLKEIITADGRTEQLKTLLDKEPDDNHVKKKFKYLTEDVKYPKSVFFIVSNEFCERFSFYGMRAILALYLNQILNYSSDQATVIYHTFLMAAYFFPLFGAILADSFIGKYQTIFYLSIVHAIGNSTLAVSAVPFLGVSPRFLCITGLFLIAFGTGGIKPCVSAFGGDQFVLPQQEKQLQQFFSVFYFSINAGSLVSTYVTPYLRYNVHCFESESCYSLAFGVPALLMFVSLVIFLCGKKYYVMKKPEGNILVQVVKCMSHAFVNKICNIGEKKSHWLNYAEDKYDIKLIEEIKLVLRVLLLFLPLPVFWALFDQQGSRWTFQATHMDGSLGWLGSIKPEQVQIINPFLILFLIPLFETFIYPCFAKCSLITRPLQRISVGGLLTAFAFIVSGLLEMQLQKTYAILPGNGIGQIRIYNGLNCNVNLESNSTLFQRNINAFDTLQIKDFPVDDYPILPFTVRTDCPSSNSSQSWTEIIKSNQSDDLALSYLITGDEYSQITVKLSPGYDDVKKSKNGIPKLRILYNVSKDTNLTLTNGKFTETLNLQKDGFTTPMNEMLGMAGVYQINVGGNILNKLNLDYGGVYGLLVVENNEDFVLKLTTIQEPNSIHMLWQIPQYIIITAAEIMVSVTGLELSYSQAPTSMKSVLSAAWLLTTSLGNLIVIIIAKLKFHSQAVEFFSFAAMMTAVMCVFMIIAKQYRYANISRANSTELHTTKNNTTNGSANQT